MPKSFHSTRRSKATQTVEFCGDFHIRVLQDTPDRYRPLLSVSGMMRITRKLLGEDLYAIDELDFERAI